MIDSAIPAGGQPGSAPAICALPGCQEVISQLPGAPPRMYCCPAHRSAARQHAVREALQAAVDKSVGTGPVGSADLTRPKSGDDAAWTLATRSRRPAGPVTAAVTAVAVFVAVLPASLMLAGDAAHHAAHHAAAARKHTPPTNQSPAATLLNQTESWSSHAEHALAQTQQLLSALSQAQQKLDAIPARKRPHKASALLRQVQQQITTLGHQEASLSVSLSAELTAWGMYLRSVLELAGVRGELGYLHGASSQIHNDHAATAAIAALTSQLAADQNYLTDQVSSWTAILRKAAAEPVPAVPAAAVANLISQVRNVAHTTAFTVTAPARDITYQARREPASIRSGPKFINVDLTAEGRHAQPQ
jgi:hypothetical protein